jgi:putative ABC transport system permease protein
VGPVAATSVILLACPFFQVGLNLMSEFLQDLRYGMRMLLKAPAFTAVALIILTLGSGANAALFSVLNAVVLRPLPYADPERLYEIRSVTARGPMGISVPDLETWRERTLVFEKMAAVWSENRILSGVGEPEHLFGLSVTRDCLPLLGTPPISGRWFSDEDFNPASPKTVLIGYRLWNRQFGRNAGIVGKPILLDGNQHIVIGIMPAVFQFNSRRCEFWVPLHFKPHQVSSRDLSVFSVYARAKAVATRQQVQGEADAMSRFLAQQFPQEHRNWKSAVARPLIDTVVADARPTLLLLLGAVGCVLLIACLNVANLLLARGAERAREIALRTAVGADRSRIVRQLLTESLLIAVLGACLGLLLAGWANRALVAFFAQRPALPRMEQTVIDARVLSFTLCIALISSIAFGLVPAFQASKLDLAETLKETGRSGQSLRSRHLRNLIIVGEVALSLMLLTGAGLMLRSLFNLLHVDTGFNASRVLTMRLPLPAFRVPDRKQQPAYYTQILERVQTIPGVRSAGLVTMLPLSGGQAVLAISSDGKGDPEQYRSFFFRAVSPDYFRALGIPLVMGRVFTEADKAGAPQVAIVNEALARQLWPGEDPIGKQLRLGKPATVVGVVRNIKHSGLTKPPEPELYLPYLQFLGVATSALVLRTNGEPLDIVPTVRERIRELQPDQPIADIRTMDQLISDSIAEPRLYALLLGVFAGLALVLAAAGVYGVVSYSVSQRSHEIGIRMAIGAQRREILKQVLREGGSYILIGIAVGIVGALLGTGLLSSLLFEVKPTDPATYVLVSLILLVCAVGAILVPARRAMTVDPLAALRRE